MNKAQGIHMRVVLGLLIAILGGLATAVGQSVAAPATKPQTSSNPPLSIAIRPLEDAVKAGSPVLLEVTITNNTKERRLVETRIPTWLMDVDVRDSQGNQPLTQRGQVVFGHGPDRINEIPVGGGPLWAVDPGKPVVINSLPVPNLFDMSKPGTYTIQVQRPDGQGGAVKSNVVKVTIVP